MESIECNPMAHLTILYYFLQTLKIPCTLIKIKENNNINKIGNLSLEFVTLKY